MRYINNLVELLSAIPGIGVKTATRLVYFLLKQDTSYLLKLSEALAELKQKTISCSNCFCYTSDPLCTICSNPTRQLPQICVVATSEDAEAIEKTASFKGTYHILQGVIDPMSGIGPEKIRVKELLARVHAFDNPEELEIIFALDSSIEATSTILYLAKQLKVHKVKTSQIVYGLSVNADIANADQQSLIKALEGRKNV